MNLDLDDLRQRLAALTPRERLLGLAGAALLGGYVFHLLAWQPVLDDNQQLQQSLLDKRETYRYLRQVAAQVVALGGDSNAGEPDAGSIAQAIEQSLRQHGLEPVVGPLLAEGERQFSVVVAGAHFDSLIGWLAALATEHGARVVGIELIRRGQQPGTVDGKLTLAF